MENNKDSLILASANSDRHILYTIKWESNSQPLLINDLIILYVYNDLLVLHLWRDEHVKLTEPGT